MLLITLLCQVAVTLTVFVYEDMEVSTLVQVGETVELQCDYQLDSALYSIKVLIINERKSPTLYPCCSVQWYRDNVEFYRFIPSEEPHTTVFIVPGMELVETTTPTNIILNNVGPETGGLFKCEVSEGPPR